MLTKEQIQNLKPGDPLIIHGTLSFVCHDGDLAVKVQRNDSLGTKFVLPSSVSLPPEKPKYDPRRLFRKGDKVRVVAWNGRDIARVGQVGYVFSNEYNSKVELTIDGWKRDVFYPVCHLELVIPVEEMEPYSVHETMSHDGWQIVRDGLPLVIYDARRHPNARAAAEDERDRLNDEWRKEQNNG